MFGTHGNKLSLGRDEPAVSDALECALLSEASLAEDWNKPEEDEAWHSFQPTNYGKIRVKLSGNDINTVFALNGDDENSATFAFSWALSKSPTLLRETIYDLVKHDVASEQILIEAQKHGQDKGFTDIEVLIRNVCHIIFEAKRYWELPSTAQLEKYAARLETSHVSKPLIVSLSAASREYSKRRLPRTIGNIPLEHRSWADIHALAQQAYCNTKSREEKLWLREFEIHFRGYVSVRNQQDNWVFVVVLSAKPITEDRRYTWIDVVDQDNHYFHLEIISGTTQCKF